MHTFYHGSPTAGLKTLRAGSFITPDLETARLMGMFYPDTGKTWTDADLAEKHKFGQQPKWKEGREPTGKPHLYQLTVDALDNIDLLDNPYEHTIKQEMPVTPYNEQLRAAISQAVKHAYEWQGRRQSNNVVDMRNSPPAAPSMFDFKVRNGSGNPVTVSPSVFGNSARYRLSNWWNGTGNTPQAQAVKKFQDGYRNGTSADIDKEVAATKNKYYTPLPDPEPEYTRSTVTEFVPPPGWKPPVGSRYPAPPSAPPSTPGTPNDTQVTGGLFEPDAPLQKESDLKPEIILQPHQQRVADRVSGPNPRMLVYHGLGTGKSLAAIAAAEAAKKNSGGEYAIVAPASLRDNFRKEIDKFTTGSHPDILSYTGMGLGQQPKNNPETLIFDEAHRLRNPEGLAAQAATEAAQKVPRVVLLTGSPITNEPSDLANLMSILRNEKITPESFENKYVQYKKVKPGWGGWLRGVKPGEEADVKNPDELKSKLRGHVDFNPGKSPDGVNINQQIIDAPMTAEQERIQKAIRTKIPPRFLWKLDKEFPLSRDELSKLNSFLTGMRQISLSTQPFRADKDHFKAFEQSGKLQTAMTKLRETLDSDPRKKALIYSNYIDAGLQPYAAALAKNKIPHAIFHGGIPLAQRRQALDEYNAGKLKALLIGPAGAEGISTKGTSLIQLLDPHWNETRSQQAQGRGLRFDSHRDLPEELKNVAIQRFISRAKAPGWFKKHIMGEQKIRTGDEILDTLAKEKEKANDKFRAILKQVGSESQQEEVARRMYEEKVPDEQQRKAAGMAWHKMAASPFKPQGFSNQFNKPPVPPPMIRTVNPATPSRQSLLTGTYQSETFKPEPQVGKPNLFGWNDKPVAQQNTVTPATTNTTLFPYSRAYPWNWAANTENVTPPAANPDRYRPVRDNATPSPMHSVNINGVAYEPELVRGPEAYGGNLEVNDAVQNAPNGYDNKHTLRMPAPPALAAHVSQDPAYEYDLTRGPAHMAEVMDSVISGRRDRARNDLPPGVAQQIDRINSGADNWTARNYSNREDIADPVGRNATHAALTSQIPWRFGGAYKRIMRDMFENKVKNTPNLSPFQIQRTNNLGMTSHSVSNPLADQIGGDPRGPASHIRLGTVDTPGMFPLSGDNTGTIGLHELEHQRQAGNAFGSREESRNKAEHPAVLSEIMHAAEGVHRLNAGRPVQGRAPLTPNYQPGLEWMRRQARQHGHVGGDRSMTELLNTPEGQAWLRMQYDELGQIPQSIARTDTLPDDGPITTAPPFTEPTSAADIRALARRFAVPQ